MTEQSQVTAPQGLGSIIMNVFSSPGEAFVGLKEGESRATLWVVSLVLLITIASIFSYVIFTNDTLKGQILDAQMQVLQKRVDAGSMTQDQMDQQRSAMERMGGMMIAFGIIGSVITLSIMFFGAGLVLWLIGKFALKSPAGYGKYLEMYGVTNWIGIFGAIVTLLMVMGLNTLYATPSAGLAVYSAYDPTNTTHKILSAINVFSIWQAVVVGIGLGKLTDKSATTGIGIAVGLWIVWVAVQMALGLAR